MEEQADYIISYQTPGIDKRMTDFVLPTTVPEKWFCGEVGIYYLQSPEGYIKIGQSKNVFKRIGKYKTHNPAIRIVGFICTGPDLLTYNENLLHRLWEPFILSLEWFAPVRPLIKYISSFQNGYGMPMELIDPIPNTYLELTEYQERIGSLRR